MLMSSPSSGTHGPGAVVGATPLVPAVRISPLVPATGARSPVPPAGADGRPHATQAHADTTIMAINGVRRTSSDMVDTRSSPAYAAPDPAQETFLRGGPSLGLPGLRVRGGAGTLRRRQPHFVQGHGDGGEQPAADEHTDAHEQVDRPRRA